MNENGGNQDGTSREKPWERSWTTEEMHENAHAWNLAGDAGLLKHLQEFSQSVLSRTHTTEKALDALSEEINTLTSEANTTNNKFLCLANTQFVENRVYDDDDKETPPSEAVPESKSKEETEAKMLQKVREALSMSVAVLDTMFEPVEIQASDSDGELENEKQRTRTLILEPHNPYIHRPLPHLIGSEAFMTDDKIGLGDTPSDGEEESIKSGADDMETSDSDVDFMAPGSTKRGRDKYSSQSSISDHMFDKDTNPKKIKPTDSSVDDSKTIEDSKVSTSPLVEKNNDFAAQLSARLGEIASPPAVRPSNRDLHSKNHSDDLFGGEVSDEEDDLFTGNSGLFSGRSKLFDDEMEDTNVPSWGPKSDEQWKGVGGGPDKTEQLDSRRMQQPKLADDLFQSVSDEDDLFSIKTSSESKALMRENDKISAVIAKQHQLNVSHLSPGVHTSTPNKNSEERMAVKTSERNTGSLSSPTPVTSSPHVITDQDKKPAGGVPMFGQANVLAGLKAKLPRRQSSSSESSVSDVPDAKSDILPSSKNVSSIVPHSVDKDHSDMAWGQDSISSQPSQSSSRGLSTPTMSFNQDGMKAKTLQNSSSQVPVISNEDNDSDGDDLFSSKSSEILPQVSSGLFADLNDEEDDLFSVIAPNLKGQNDSSANAPRNSGSNNQSKVEPSASSIFTKQESEKPPLSSISKSLTASNSSRPSSERYLPPNDVGKNDIYSTIPPPLKSDPKVKKPVSLFDDSDSGEDELLFSSASSAGSRRSQASTDILAAAAVSTVEKKPLSKKGLFDDDERLFGDTLNDPGIDIFSGSSKPKIDKGPIQKLPQPTSNSGSIVEDLSSQNESDAFSQGATFKTSTLPTKAPQANVKKSIFEDNLPPADNIDDVIDTKSNESLNKKGETMFPSEDDSIEDDIFKTIPASAQMPSKLPKFEAPPDASSICEEKDSSFENSPQTEPSQFTLNKNLVSTQKNQLPSQEDTPVATNAITTLSPRTDSNLQHDHVVPKKPEPPRTLNIRNETDPGLNFLAESDDDDDLFSSVPPKRNLKSESSQLQYPRVTSTASDLFSSPTSTVDPNQVPPSKQPPKPSVAVRPVSLISSVSTTESQSSHKDELPTPNKSSDKESNSDASEIDGAIVSVSKLRSSLLAGGDGQAPLKLDPNALLPGRKNLSRRNPPREDALSPAGAQNTEPSKSIANETPVGFDEPLINNATLPSANKDRAKLGAKRRPPSSKARRDAARASQILDDSDKDSPLSPDTMLDRTNSVGAVNSSVASSNSFLSPSTDEDDLFGVPQDLPSGYGNNYVPSADIFSGARILSPVASGNLSVTDYESKRNDSPEAALNAENNSYKQETKLILTTPKESKASEDELFIPSSDAFSKDIVSQPTETSAVKASALSMNHDQRTTIPPSVTPSPSKLENLPSERDITSSFSAQESNQTDIQISSSQNFDVEKVANSNSESIEGIHKSAVPVSNDSAKSSVREALTSSAALDPLNKVDPSLVANEEESIGTEDKNSDFDDHSSLFPFVKKKSESKPLHSQPLFSETPALPSKIDKSVAKPDLGGFDDVEDDDLFVSSSRLVTGNKPKELTTTLKGKEPKVWDFSADDDDDDDLFQSSSKSLTSKSLAKGNSLVSSTASLHASVESRNLSSAADSFEQKKPKKLLNKPSSQNGIFSDEDDNDDLFSKPSQFSKSKSKGTPSERSSLFDDDDDDLFGPKQGGSKNTPTQSDARDVGSAGSQPPKLKKEDVFDDPLKAHQKDKL